MGNRLAFVTSASTTPHISMVGWESVAILPVPTKIRVSAFLVKIEFPLKHTKNKPVKFPVKN